MGITFFAFCLLSCHDSKWILNVNGAPQALASALAIDIQKSIWSILAGGRQGVCKEWKKRQGCRRKLAVLFFYAMHFDNMYIDLVRGMFPKFRFLIKCPK